jgi:thiamine pyrophosphate-dependent acetolactate synthase large subunit-like protein
VLKQQHADLRAADRAAAQWGWDASPISTARLSYELAQVLKNEDWSLVSPVQFFSNWPLRMWSMTKSYQYLGRQGASGEGYAAPALIGAALAMKKQGRIPVCIQNDGDLMYQPGSYWTAAHHKLPLLSVMHNNRAWHQEVMHVQRMANRRQRGITNAHIGTTLIEPEIDYAKMIAAMGVWTAGPIREPGQIRPALERALAAVKRGEPALVDVHTQSPCTHVFSLSRRRSSPALSSPAAPRAAPPTIRSSRTAKRCSRASAATSATATQAKAAPRGRASRTSNCRLQRSPRSSVTRPARCRHSPPRC